MMEGRACLVVVQHCADFVAEWADLVLVDDDLPRQAPQRPRPRVAVVRRRLGSSGAGWLRRGDANLHSFFLQLLISFEAFVLQEAALGPCSATP